MREAAISCGIRAFAVAASRNASQSTYALHYVAEGGDRAKLECYQTRLHSRGLRSTLALGSTGDLGTDDGLLFARVREACELPPMAMITRSEDKITVYGVGSLSEPHRICIIRLLRASGRFSDIQFSIDPFPALPTTRF